MCDTWQAMCQNAWLTMKAINMGMGSSFHTAASFSPWEQQGEGGGREKIKGGKEKRNGGM